MGFRTFLVLATLGLAESSIVSMFLIGNENPQPLVGSIVAVDEDTTTYSINCAKTVDIDHCAFLPGLLYTAGPSSIEYAFKAPFDKSGTVICSMGGTTSAICTVPPTGTGVASMTTTLGEKYLSSEGVTITAGATKAADGSSPTKTDDASKGTNSEDSASQTASGSESTSTGGMPHITVAPRIALGGAAAAFMAAVL